MSEEIYINNGTSFQQPYIARNTVNSQTPVIGQTTISTTNSWTNSFYISRRRTFPTYRNPVNYRIPYIANATGTTPVIANSQSPYIANAQQPARARVGYRVPFTYQNRQPAYIDIQDELLLHIQTTINISSTGRSPYPYIANARRVQHILQMHNNHIHTLQMHNNHIHTLQMHNNLHE